MVRFRTLLFISLSVFIGFATVFIFPPTGVLFNDDDEEPPKKEFAGTDGGTWARRHGEHYPPGKRRRTLEPESVKNVSIQDKGGVVIGDASGVFESHPNVFLASRGTLDGSNKGSKANPVESWVFDIVPTTSNTDHVKNSPAQWQVVLSNTHYSSQTWWSSSQRGQIDSNDESFEGCRRYLASMDEIVFTRDRREHSASPLLASRRPGSSANRRRGGGRWFFDTDGKGGLSLAGGKGAGIGSSRDSGEDDAESILSVFEYAHHVGPDHFEALVSVPLPFTRRTEVDGYSDINDNSPVSRASTLQTVAYPLTFRFDRGTCTFWSNEVFHIPLPRREDGGKGVVGGEAEAAAEKSGATAGRNGNMCDGAELPVGLGSFVFVNHLYTAYEGIREDVEHVNYVHKPLRRLEWSGRLLLDASLRPEEENFSRVKPSSPHTIAVVPQYDNAQEVWLLSLMHVDVACGVLSASVVSKSESVEEFLDSGRLSQEVSGVALRQPLIVESAHAVIQRPPPSTSLSFMSATKEWLAVRPDPNNLLFGCSAMIELASSSRKHAGSQPVYVRHPAGGYPQSTYYRDYYLTYKHLKKEQYRAALTKWETENAQRDSPLGKEELVLLSSQMKLCLRRVPSRSASARVRYSGYAALSTMDLLGRLDLGVEYAAIGSTNPHVFSGLEGEGDVPHRAPPTLVVGEALDRRLEVSCRRPLSSLNKLQEWVNSPAYPSPEICLYTEDALRNKVIYFIGDSHMRVLYYGFLSRMGISYPLNKVWRGDRSDFVPPPYNVTVHYISSYFLNLSRPNALEMLKKSQRSEGVDNDVIIIANVGQHHSAHCWSLKKHSAFVREALLTLLYGRVLTDDTTSDLFVVLPKSIRTLHRFPNSPEQPPLRMSFPDERQLHHFDDKEADPSASRLRNVIWFSVPAQPINRHLYTAKPIGQSRRDCRNNQRHLLMNLEQRLLWESVLRNDLKGLRSFDFNSSSNRGTYFVDAFSLSYGMSHTSLDGAHYFSFVRAEWIDEVIRGIRSIAATHKK